MITSKQLIEGVLKPYLQIASLEHHQGGTGAQVLTLHDVFKAGAPMYIDLELGIYRDLQARLGNLYFDIFPQVVLWHRDGEKAILEMTWLGQSLEQEILMPLSRGEWSLVLAVWSNAPPILEKLALLDLVIEGTLSHLEAMFTVTQLDDPATMERTPGDLLLSPRLDSGEHLFPKE